MIGLRGQMKLHCERKARAKDGAEKGGSCAESGEERVPGAKAPRTNGPVEGQG